VTFVPVKRENLAPALLADDAPTSAAALDETLSPEPSADSIRQHKSAYVCIRQHPQQHWTKHLRLSRAQTAYVSIRQHTSAYVSICQHPQQHWTKHLRLSRAQSASVSIRQHPSASVSIRQHPSASVSIRQHPSASVSARQHKSAALNETLAPEPQIGPNYLVLNYLI
jgi:hypothetical protein